MTVAAATGWVLLATAPAKAGLTKQAVEGGIVIHGTVVTMDGDRTILHNGGVFIRGERIVAAWQGSHVPPEAAGAVHVDLGPKTLIFPGLIDLHDHPTYDFLHLWPAPSSHRQPLLGRPLGTEAYADRYQWNLMMGRGPTEFRRLVDTPQRLVTTPPPFGLGLGALAVKYAEVRALLGGETVIQGGSNTIADHTLIRNVEAETLLGEGRIEGFVSPIDSLPDTTRTRLIADMGSGQLAAWIVHLAEGLRDADRPPGDPYSSRNEFATLQAKGLLTDATVIVHGTGLEAEDFAAMRAAPTLRTDHLGDGLGAKLVWSPLSNLLLYGKTTAVYRALQAGVLVSLGTDWSPSGSRTLLDELKVADIALRDPRVLGTDRDLVSALSVTGKTGDAREAAEAALDQALVEMVTSNPARTLRWTQNLGSIEPGKLADLLVITEHNHPSAEDLPKTPYRSLIDATEEDVRLVLVDGNPLCGDVDVMESLRPGDSEVISSTGGCFEKAVDVTDPSVPQGTQTLASIQQRLRSALAAMAGDHPPPGGGPAPLTNTYSELWNRIPAAQLYSLAQFTQVLASPKFAGTTLDGRLNMEAVQLAPVLVADDDFAFHLLGGDAVPGTRLIADATPPFKLYASNFNHIGPLGNPFEASVFADRYYQFCSAVPSKAVTDEPPAGRSDSNSRREGAIWPVILNASPNPARSATQLVLQLPTSGHVSLRIYDVAGRLVKSVVESTLQPGQFRYDWDLKNAAGAPVPAGIYLARMKHAAGTVVSRIVVLP
jgi:cytosine/adenosine deaminase-related metal-dependent hydrolase